MGSGRYGEEAHAEILRARADLPAQKVFTQRSCHPLMNPKGVRVRECRDSVDHPNSLGIVFALDVTGSMGSIPECMATRELPGFMKVLYACQVPDPQLLFLAVGDATSDQAPLQVGQFESTAELMDQWLTWTWLEGNGGAWGKESYELGLYFCAEHIEMDCVVKREKKGYLFMTGDEHPYPALSRHIVESVLGDKLDDDLPIEAIVADLLKSFHVFFLVPDQDRRRHCEERWREILGDHVLCMDTPSDVCFVAAGAVLISEGLVQSQAGLLEKLRLGGLPRERAGAVSRTLRPLLGGGEPVEDPEPPGVLERLLHSIFGS